MTSLDGEVNSYEKTPNSILKRILSTWLATR